MPADKKSVITSYSIHYTKLYDKTAGFTGTRCAFTVVPKELMGYTESGEAYSIHKLWYRRQSTKFNQVSYPVQKAAAAIYTPEGKKEVKATIAYYIDDTLPRAGG